MKIEEIDCKVALSPSKLPGIDYSLNPYYGCQHQCVYCYVPSVLHIPQETWKTSIQVKRNIPLVLSKELQMKKSGVVGISTVTDPYQPLEKTYRLTRYCLQQLLKKNYPVCIQTKSSLVLQDIDIINQFSQAEVMISIATLNDAHRRLLEPASSSIHERLHVLKTFSQTNVKTSVFFGPIYPTITVDQIPEILDTFIDVQVDEIMVDIFHIKPGLQQHLTTIFNDTPELRDTFSLKKLTDKEWFATIRHAIEHYLKNTDITVVDAF